MIDFDYWLSEIVGVCELIISDDAFRKVWVVGDYSFTSVHDYRELCEQLNCLHLSELATVFAPRIADSAAVQILIEFDRALQVVDSQIEENPALEDPTTLLGSTEWHSFRESAKRVVELPCSHEYRYGRKEHEILDRLRAEREKSEREEPG